MRISSDIGGTASIIGDERAVVSFAEAGFDAWDFSMFDMFRYDGERGAFVLGNHPLGGNEYLAYARKLKHIGLDHGIVCNQSHAPFPSSMDVISYLKRAIECTAEAGGSICVIHPINNGTPQENAEMYEQLLPFAKEHGVKIAAENMWNWDNEKGQSSFAACATSESFLEHLELVNDPYFVACLDLGHAEMRGSGSGAVAMIKALGKHLQALHIHDNDCLHDSHQIPFSMQIDFVPIVEALREINYSGDFTLEACNYMPGCPEEEIPTRLRCLAESARRLADMFERGKYSLQTPVTRFWEER